MGMPSMGMPNMGMPMLGKQKYHRSRVFVVNGGIFDYKHLL